MEIEHYVAKTVDPFRAFEWTNLFPSCRSCNTSKGHGDHGGTLLKPDEEDSEPLLWFDPGTGDIEPHPKLADGDRLRVQFTIDKLKLNRGALASERRETFHDIRRWIDREALNGPDGLLRKEELLEYLDPKQSFKFVIRLTFERYGMAGLAAEDRRAFGSHP